MNLSIYGANAILDGTAIPATLWVQLHSGNPGSSGASNVAVDNRRRSFTRTAASGGAAANAAILEWLSAPADENITHATLWSASSGGNCWFIGLVNDSPVEVVTGRTTETPLGLLSLNIPTWS